MDSKGVLRSVPLPDHSPSSSPSLPSAFAVQGAIHATIAAASATFASLVGVIAVSFRFGCSDPGLLDQLTRSFMETWRGPSPNGRHTAQAKPYESKRVATRFWLFNE